MQKIADCRTIVTVVVALIAIGMQSCQINRVANGGTFFGDVDKYFNPTEGISVWVYRAFQPRDSGRTGLRLTRGYPLDSLVLEQTGLARRHNLVLFSVVPEERPFYNLLAIKHAKRNVNLVQYESIENDDSSYYQRDFSWNGLVVRHVYIPYGKKYGLSCLYYITAAQHRQCPFCELDYLVKINAKSFPQTARDLSTWEIFDCSDSQRVAYEFTPEASLLKGDAPVYLRIYEKFGAHKFLCYFRILRKRDPTPISLGLCPGRYYIEYSSESQEVLEIPLVDLERQTEPID